MKIKHFLLYDGAKTLGNLQLNKFQMNGTIVILHVTTVILFFINYLFCTPIISNLIQL